MPKADAKPRKRKMPKYRHFRVSKAIKHPVKLPSSFKVFIASIKTLTKYWKLFVGILVVYAALNILLVHGFGGSLNLTNLKYNLQQIGKGQHDQLLTSVSLFGALVSSSGSTASTGGNIYQSLLLLVTSLALIWGLRQVNANKLPAKLKIRDAFYKSMYPLIPFVLVIIVISLQLLPMLVGGTVYSLVINNGVAVTALEKFFWALAFFLLCLLSLYMLTSSLFALYIVTLPDMTPLKALRSARQLVQFRRWTVMRKILFLPLSVLVIAGLVMLPTVLFLTPAAEWLFFAFTTIGLAVIHSYMYMLYRELLVNE